jgi:hypothetical protein
MALATVQGMSTATTGLTPGAIDAEVAFYQRVLRTLTEAGIPVLVGGAYSMAVHTGIERNTKDLDLFLRRTDYDAAAQALGARGCAMELTFPHWLGKAHQEPYFVDLIFNSGNAMTPVDDAWFTHAIDAEILGIAVRVVPVEELLWSKAFLMERERYDGADVAHLLRVHATSLDWARLMERMAPIWRVLLSHLVLFGFIYPAQRAQIPAWVMTKLLARLREEMESPPPNQAVCGGTLLSREQYLHDVLRDGYTDARLQPFGPMSAEDIATWTQDIAESETPSQR